MTFFEKLGQNKLPNILIFTGQVVSTAHGTGNAIIRNFRGYPREKLLNVYYIDRGEPAIPSLKWDHRSHRAFVESKDHRVINPLSGIRKILELQKFKPDIIYSTFFGVFGCKIVQKIIEEYDYNIPVIQHALDISVPHNDFSLFAPALKEIAPLVDEFWALTPSLAKDYSKATDRDVKIVNVFSDINHNNHKTEHAEFSPEFTAIITGNIWNTPLIPDIMKVWRNLQNRLPGLAPIHWYGHPVALAPQLEDHVFVEDNPPIEYKGFPSRRMFYKTLADADMMLLPFNRTHNPESHYARYSLPSRLTETLHAGLPVFAFAGLGTDTGQYIQERGFGEIGTPDNPRELEDKLFQFIVDKNARAKYGAKALEIARTEYNLDLYQEFLLDAFKRVIRDSKQKTPIQKSDVDIPMSKATSSLSFRDDGAKLVRNTEKTTTSASNSHKFSDGWEAISDTHEHLHYLLYKFGDIRQRRDLAVEKTWLGKIPVLRDVYKLIMRIRDIGFIRAIQNDINQTQADYMHQIFLMHQNELRQQNELIAQIQQRDTESLNKGKTNTPLSVESHTASSKRTQSYKQKYDAVFMLAMPRSGSNLLKLALAETGIVGEFREYFNTNQMHEYFAEKVDSALSPQVDNTWEQISESMFRDYAEHCFESYASEHNRFGTKFHRAYMKNVEAIMDPSGEFDFHELLGAYFNHIHYIIITRRDKIRQAISLARAYQDGLWASNQAIDAKSMQYEYDYQHILNLLKSILKDELEFKAFLRKHDLQATQLHYEDFVEHYSDTIRQVITDIDPTSLDHVVIPEPPLQKQSNHINDEFEEKFRRDAADWLTPDVEEKLQNGIAPPHTPLFIRNVKIR